MLSAVSPKNDVPIPPTLLNVRPKMSQIAAEIMSLPSHSWILLSDLPCTVYGARFFTSQFAAAVTCFESLSIVIPMA